MSGYCSMQGGMRRGAGCEGEARSRRSGAVSLFAVLVFVMVPTFPIFEASARPLDYPEVELEDVIEVDLVGRDLFAYDLLGTRSPGLRLELGETVLWIRASGRVGIVVTDRRLLAVTNENATWQEIRLRVHESRPDRSWLGKRLALVLTNQRLLGYDSGSGLWIEANVGPNETVRDVQMGAQTGLVLTDRRAYGLSPGVGDFISTPMSIHERIEGLRVGANIAQVSTSRRVLVFRSPIGSWTESRRKIH